jgi:hypothetical protein
MESSSRSGLCVVLFAVQSSCLWLRGLPYLLHSTLICSTLPRSVANDYLLLLDPVFALYTDLGFPLPALLPAFGASVGPPWGIYLPTY